MASNQFGNNKAYGLQNPLQQLAPEPIIALRNPTAADKAEMKKIKASRHLLKHGQLNQQALLLLRHLMLQVTQEQF